MTCPTDKLELFHDGELAPAERDAVRAHLAECAACRAEVDQLAKLDGVLKVPAGPQPKWDQYVAKVRARTSPGWGRWVAALAAAVLVGLTIWNVVDVLRPKKTQTVAALPDPVGAYLAAKTDADRAKVLAQIQDGQLPEIVAALDHPEVKRQIAAAQILASIRKDKVRDLLLEYAKKQEPVENEDLLEGVSPQVVTLAMQKAEESGRVDTLTGVIGKGALDPEIREAVTKWAQSLLASKSPRLRRLGLEIVKEVDVDFPWTSVIDLVDDPEVGTRAVEALRDRSGRDFGADKKAWKRYLEEL